MFGARRNVVVSSDSPTVVGDPTPARREKPPARESKVFAPSSFAARKAEAEARAAIRAQPRLVYMGTSEYTMRNRNGGIEIVEGVRLYFDADHPRKRYADIPGYGMTPMQDESGVTDSSTPLPPLRGGFGRPRSLRDPSPADPPPRPV
jgi:hypothetical protein